MSEPGGQPEQPETPAPVPEGGVKGFAFRKKKEMPGGLWIQCPSCRNMVLQKEVDDRHKVCPQCAHHFPLAAEERIALLLDAGSFEEWDADLLATDPLSFPKYQGRLESLREETGLTDAVMTGGGTVNGRRISFGCTDFRFFAGSMGSVVGERLTRAIERAAERKLPLVIVSGSGGGARMQEAAYSLMQMVKTSAALGRFQEAGGLFISVLTNPTMGGVMASYASLGDVTIAEPKALIGFTGPRVIQQTIRADLPEGFQTSEFMLEHGMIDMIVPRGDLKLALTKLVEYCTQ